MIGFYYGVHKSMKVHSITFLLYFHASCFFLVHQTVEAEIHAAEVTGGKVDPAAKIKLLTAEEEAIARENEEDAQALQQKIAEVRPSVHALSV